jgi:GNAT superfamily N-acetyltransferase
METMEIRPAVAADVAAMLAFVHELAIYEREPDAVKMTAGQLDAALFAETAHLFAHVAVDDAVVVGMAIWFLNFSTWEGTHGIYLEDLYVTPAARGRGAGKALLGALAGICVERGYARLEWSVLDWNEPALGFYRSIGAVGMDEWTVQRMSGSPLRVLGQHGTSAHGFGAGPAATHG